MALQIKLRNGTAAVWTSTNPVLAQGEPGVETDTGKFKIGDGTTAWSSLSYQGSTGATQTKPYRSFGDGSDGNVTISSGTTTLTRDMFYNNLTLSGSGILNTNGYKVFIKGILDIKNAAAGAIQWNGNNGNNASGATGGAAPASQPGATLGSISTGGTGPTATTGNGSAGGVGVTIAGSGGIGGSGGNGGTGTNGGGGNGAVGRTPTNHIFIRKFETNMMSGINLLSAGGGGGSGASGAGDGVNTGGGGGGGGSGGGFVAIYANIILKSSSTVAGTITANGGNGGNGGSSSAGETGGGGGGGAGAGGWVYVCYNILAGPIVSNLIFVNGGVGGTGGNGVGVTGTGGDGGDGGSGGRVTLINVPLSTVSDVIGVSNVNILSELTGTIVDVNKGGNGGFGGTMKVSL